jgi:hypothetical protein
MPAPAPPADFHVTAERHFACYDSMLELMPEPAYDKVGTL